MLHPAPTTKIDPTLARGTVLEVCDATANTPAQVVLSFPNTSYKSAFETHDGLEMLRSRIGEMVMGRIYAKARRVDQPQAGGRRIDPCLGTPRRVMGTVVGVDPSANVVVMDAGVPVLLTLSAPGQQAQQFVEADFIACDVFPGTRFALQIS
jgi:hypothetical protein